MPRVRLIHWKKSEAAEHFKVLHGAGYAIEYDEQLRPGLMKEWRENPPAAFAIDLSRLPSHGKEIAVALRQYKQTRTVPLVFCGGDAAKVSAIRELLPDAAYCELKTLSRTIQRSLKTPPKDPVRPAAMMDRYGSRTVAEKLGVKEGSVVAVVNPPRDVDAILMPLPNNAELKEVEAADSDANLYVCFVKEPEELSRVLSALRSVAAHSKFWIAWRKGGKRQAGDMTENFIRTQALDLGLVDYKICSLNAVWSAIALALKR